MKFGDTWEEPVTGKKNLCWVCTCYSRGKATCSADSLFCPPTDCKKPVRTEGHCCKKCRKFTAKIIMYLLCNFDINLVSIVYGLLKLCIYNTLSKNGCCCLNLSNTPNAFYSFVLSDLAFEWKRGWS